MQHLEIGSRKALLISGYRAMCVHEEGSEAARPVAVEGQYQLTGPCVHKLRNNIAPINEVLSAPAARVYQPFSCSEACLEIGTS